MIRRIGVSVCLAGLAFLPAGMAQEPKAPAKPAESKADDSTVSPIAVAVQAELADRQRQDQAIAWLREPSDVHFAETALKDVVAFLADAHKARIRIDSAVSATKLILADLPITISVSEQPLSHVLNRAVRSPQRSRELELAWTVHRGDIVITTSDEQKQMLETRVYRGGRLAQLMAARAVVDWQSVVRLLEEAIAAPWMNRDGEGGTISQLGDQLVIRQTFPIQERIAGLLKAVEAALARPPGSSPLLVMSSDEAQRWQHVQKALRRDLDLRLDETPLEDVVRMLAEQTEVEVFVDSAALKTEKIAEDLALNLPDGRYAARDAMQLALKPHRLTAVIDDGAIRITTAQAAGRVQQLIVYDVADLLRTEEDVQRLRQTVIESTNGPWISTDGTGGELTDFQGLLVIRHTEAIQTQIALLLHELRQAQKHAPKEAARPLPNDVVMRFYKTKSKEEAESLERLILSFVAPTTWDVSGGKGLFRVAEDRIIIQQTKTVHDEIDQFLREYQQAKPIAK